MVTQTNPEVFDTSAIERLRALTPAQFNKINVETVCALLDSISREPWHGPSTLGRKLGLSDVEVMDLVRDLGTWAGQAFGTDKSISVLEADEAEAAFEDNGQLKLLPEHFGNTVVVPLGFESHLTRRELDRAIGNIVMLNRPVHDASVRLSECTRRDGHSAKNGMVEERDAALAVLTVELEHRHATLSRWLLRRYHLIRQVLTYPIVAGVHRVAQLDRFAELDSLALGRNGWCNTELARVLVEAFDLLDVARLDAITGFEDLAGINAGGVTDPAVWDRIARNVSKTRWVAQGEISRLEEALDRSRNAGCDLGLSRQLAVVVELSNSPQWRPASIAVLSDGNVKRIAEGAGLATEDSSYAEESQVRRMISDAGLEADADLLFSDGLRVVKAGLADELAEAFRRRANGDTDWSDDLNRALEGISPTVV